MTRRIILPLLGLLTLTPLCGWSFQTRAQPASEMQWIWFNEGDPLAGAPAETRWFRRVFTIVRPVANPVDEATLDITADNAFAVWVNGVKVGSGSDWHRVARFDVKRHLVHGKNVIAVEAKNDGGPAGLLVRLGYVPNGLSKLALFSDGLWKASKTAGEGWQKLDFDDGAWSKVKVLGGYGKVGPWRDLAWAGGASPGGGGRFTVPEGFRVEQAVRAPDDDPRFSLVNMTFDAKGRLLVSRERGPVLVCTEPDKKGVLQTVKPYCTQVKNCQGMCWVKDALLLVGDGPNGTGLYRCRDTKGADKVDEVKLLHKFQGGMGEHGPHAIIHGPDNWLYLVIGNHAHAQVDKLADNSPLRRWPTGAMGPDQGKPGSTEDVLLPRLNDARGHAANILAPGGTIWRLDREGKNMSLVTAGFRNHFDAAFAPDGELFTFDSDMEWDENLPWYRAVRVCHCPPGADFVWRTGAANTPSYYLDGLPPILETGRGSPVGLEFYDHHVYPEKYRGAYFMADWSLGIIYAVFLKRNGASYKATSEKFCSGSPMNVTDLAVGPDGAMYLTMGGRGTQGGVYRIVNQSPTPEKPVPGVITEGNIPQDQPLAGWSRARYEQFLQTTGKQEDRHKYLKVSYDLLTLAYATCASKSDAKGCEIATRNLIQVLTLMQNHGARPSLDLLRAAARDKAKSGDLRAHAVWLLGVNGYKEGRDTLIQALGDEDALVRRRACEALIRAGFEPPVAALWPLLADKDRFVRTAARLVLQRIDPKKWTERLWKEPKDLVAWEGILALCKTNQAAPYAEQIFARLHRDPPAEVTPLLGYLRTLQMALFHAGAKAADIKAIARQCDKLFPHADKFVNRELAILLTHFVRVGILDSAVHTKLLDALLASEGDRQQQIHYFYCLRLLHDGWTTEQKSALLTWYDGTKTWSGGHSFTPFLENILRDARPIFTLEDSQRLVAQGERYPLAATALLRMANESQLPPLTTLAELYARIAKAPAGPSIKDLKTVIVATLGKKRTPEAESALRKIADSDPAQRDLVATSLARHPSAENFPYLVNGLASTNKLLLFDIIDALKKCPGKPKADDPAPYRAVLVASGRLDERNRWKTVELLRHWSNNKQFGADNGEWKTELASWSKWFGQTFPKEPALQGVAGDKPIESKYKYDELLAFLNSEGKTGDVLRGRVVFEKAQCIKCHKYGKDGEGVGPDLTTLSKRFKRVDVLESIYYPSKVISDQYRSTQIVTKKGQQLNGLAAVQGDTVTVLLSDGNKVTLKKGDIDQQFASLVSVMPEKLLDALTKREIADLFAFMESEPAK